MNSLGFGVVNQRKPAWKSPPGPLPASTTTERHHPPGDLDKPSAGWHRPRNLPKRCS